MYIETQYGGEIINADKIVFLRHEIHVIDSRGNMEKVCSAEWIQEDANDRLKDEKEFKYEECAMLYRVIRNGLRCVLAEGDQFFSIKDAVGECIKMLARVKDGGNVDIFSLPTWLRVGLASDNGEEDEDGNEN